MKELEGAKSEGRYSSKIKIKDFMEKKSELH